MGAANGACLLRRCNKGSLVSTDTDSTIEPGAVAGGFWGVSWADADAKADKSEHRLILHSFFSDPMSLSCLQSHAGTIL